MTLLPGVPPRELQIDWSSFLDRPPIASPTPQSLDRLRRAPILITGAGGSIGSALSLRFLALRPKALVLLEASEQALYRLQAELQRTSPNSDFASYLGSVNDAQLLDEIFSTFTPEYVFHAAAHKHLPLLEHHPLAAIQNNALATVTLMKCAAHHANRHRIRVILLSTDKAADPTSILGATKRIAEQVILAHGGIALRLVNVLGSEGSVVETFLEQIAQNKPLTITNPQARRFFMTSKEAVDLLISAALNASDSSLLAPPLTRAHSVEELAQFLGQTHAKPNSTRIEYSQLRDGEKLVETLYATGEIPGNIDATGCTPICRSNRIDRPHLEALLIDLQKAVSERDTINALHLVRQLVPNYSPSPTVLEAANRSIKAVQANRALQAIKPEQTSKLVEA